MMTDLLNKLLLIPDWNLDVLHSPIHSTLAEPVYKDELMPFAMVQAMTVEVPMTALYQEDTFIDDIINFS